MSKKPEETWMNDPLSLDAGLPATSQEGEAMALIYAMAEYSPHVMQAQHGKTVCDDYARAAIIAATPTPPTVIPVPKTAKELTAIIEQWLAQDGDWGEWEKALDALCNPDDAQVHP